MSVALRVADANEKTLAQLRAQVGGQGKLVPAKEFVESLLPEDQARLPGAVRKGFILVVWSPTRAPGPRAQSSTMSSARAFQLLNRSSFWMPTTE